MNSGRPYSVPVSRNPVFATTHWSVVLKAGRQSSPESNQALASLCETYWFPLYAYVRRRISDVNEAQDLTQSFFTELLDKNYIGQAIPERGKFRSFLITAFKHFLSKERDQRKAQKRGGGRSPISLDFVAADSSPGLDPERGLSPEQLYERKWTITVLGSVLERLRHELVESGKRELFEQLKHFLIGDSTIAFSTFLRVLLTL